MRNRNIVYRKIYARMALLGVCKREVARLLGINYTTLQNKLSGVTDFTLTEAIRLKRILCIKDDLEDAFEKFDPCMQATMEEISAYHDKQ